jgi:hypothetical protein
MKKDWKYILYVSIAVALFITVKLMAPKQFDWTVTFAHNDKDPYGGHCLYRLLPSINDSVKHNYKTIYEITDSIGHDDNFFILSSRFSPAQTDVEALLKHIHRGGRAFVSAHRFSGALADTLQFRTADNLFRRSQLFDKGDSSYITFSNPALNTVDKYWFRTDNIYNYFDSLNTATTTVIARNNYHEPVTVKINFGQGYLVVNCTPLAFTNIYLLSNDHHKFVSKSLSYLDNGKIFWSEFYHLGRRELQTPLRFILTTEPLAWAYYIAIVSILLFMIFEAKRRQRIIPVIRPLSNTTLEFVSTIGNLYFQTANHKNIGDKKIQFLLDHIRTKYRVETNIIDSDFIQTLAIRSGKTEAEVRELFQFINLVSTSSYITSDQLIKLNHLTEKFHSLN